MKKEWGLLYILLLVTPLFSLDPTLEVSQYVHESWGLEQGLPQNVIHAVLQTRGGYIWLGTEEGLARFDGVKFTVFDKNNTPALKSNWINELYEDKAGHLWIGTSGGGLTCLRGGKFFTYGAREGLTGTKIEGMCEDGRGTLWAGTDGEGVFQSKGDRFTPFKGDRALTGNKIRALYRDRQGNLWVGTYSGLNRIAGGGVTTYTTENSGLAHNNVRAICEDNRGRLWIGTQDGLNCMEGKNFHTFTTEHGLKDNQVQVLLEDKDRGLWIGTANGVHRLAGADTDTLDFRENCSHRLGEQDICSLMEDREGALWIGTYNSGIHRFRKGRFTTFTASEGIAHHVAKCVLQTGGGSLWVGTDGGLSRIKNTGGAFGKGETLVKGIHVTSLHQGRRGNLWIGTDRALNYLENPGQAAPGNCRPAVIWGGGLYIHAIYQDREGNLWVGTAKGLKCFREGIQVPLPFPRNNENKALTAGPTYVILQGRQGGLRFGTRKGLFLFREGGLTAYTAGNGTGLDNDGIKSLYEDGNGSLWIGTRGGLARLKNGKIASITTGDGLFNDTIHQVLEDGANNLWMSCNKGVFRVAKKEVEDFFDRNTDSVHCAAYNEADGMKSRECNGATQPAGCKSMDGKLWFPTMDGVVMIEPDNLRDNPLEPPVMIESIRADKAEMLTGPAAVDENITVPPGVNRLVISYTALSFQVPGRVRFKTRLEGYDEEWTEEAGRRSFDYTHLGPGDYTFRVMACNNDGVWNRLGASVSFYVRPTFFQTPWFYVLCAAALLGLFFLGHRLRVRRLKVLAGKLRTMVDDRTRELSKRSWDLEQRNLELVTLEQAVRDINREMELENLLQVLLRAAMELFPRARAGVYFIYDESARRYTARVREGLETPPGETAAYLPEEDLEILKRGSRELEKDIYYCPDASLLERRPGLPPAGTFPSLLAVAGTVDGQPRGLLVLGAHGPSINIGSRDIQKLVIFREHAVYALARARTLQDLSALVEERTTELSRANEQLEHRLRELLRAQEALTGAREAAERAHRVKTRFLTNISHEVRTPMNSILGFTEILQTEITNQRHRRLLDAVLAGGETLMALINDILDLSQIEAGKVELQYEPTNPVTILEELKHMFQKEAQEKNLTLEILPGQSLPELLLMDHTRVRQVLFNLVGNALKFTGKGSVTISAHRAGVNPGDRPETVDIAFSVKDTGIGIPGERQEVIFEVFRQHDGLQLETYGGTGLGLGISRKLVEMMNGAITVESELNRGSTFTVHLPGVRVCGAVRLLPDSMLVPLKDPGETRALILVADDVEMNRAVLVDVLENSGFKTIEAENGEEVLHMAARRLPDLILMDIRMPVMSGLEAARVLKGDPKLKHIPILILTAYASHDEELQKSRDVVDDFLFKPASQKQIFTKIAQLVPRLAASEKAGEDGEGRES